MYCILCKKETDNPKFCSSSCAASYNNRGVRRHGQAPVKNNCLSCGELTSIKFCSNKCQGAYKRKIICEQVESNEIVRWKQIKRYLLDKDPKCSECGINSWRDKPISLECDHIDGDGTNNRLNNARLLCPNCHSQTDTFRAKNTKNPKGKEYRRKRYEKVIKNMVP